MAISTVNNFTSIPPAFWAGPQVVQPRGVISGPSAVFMGGVSQEPTEVWKLDFNRFFRNGVDPDSAQVILGNENDLYVHVFESYGKDLKPRPLIVRVNAQTGHPIWSHELENVPFHPPQFMRNAQGDLVLYFFEEGVSGKKLSLRIIIDPKTGSIRSKNTYHWEAGSFNQFEPLITEDGYLFNFRRIRSEDNTFQYQVSRINLDAETIDWTFTTEALPGGYQQGASYLDENGHLVFGIVDKEYFHKKLPSDANYLWVVDTLGQKMRGGRFEGGGVPRKPVQIPARVAQNGLPAQTYLNTAKLRDDVRYENAHLAGHPNASTGTYTKGYATLCLDPQTNQVKWQRQTERMQGDSPSWKKSDFSGSGPTSSFFLPNGDVVIHVIDKVLKCEGDTGNEVWSKEIPGLITGSHTDQGNIFVLQSVDEKYLIPIILNQENGEILWEGDKISKGPRQYSNPQVIRDRTGKILVFTGDQLHSFRPGSF